LLDSVVIANETVDFLRKEKRMRVIVKVDFEKVYDSVEWEFLEYMMNWVGFHYGWINWIKSCLKFVTISILINGNPTKEFRPTRGIRQGDPLALFMFLIVVEGLVGLVGQASRSGVLEGVKAGNREVEVKMLQLSNDTIFLVNQSLSVS